MNKSNNMNILITGGAGFLGANLARSLIKEGHSVTSMDNFHSGRKENLISCEDSSSFQSIAHDIRKPIDMSDNIDQIYHLACPASPKFYQADPIYTTETCVIGTLNVLNFALKKNAKILFTSTSEVYGDPEVHPQPESYRGSVNSTGIRACYDEGKRCAESITDSPITLYGDGTQTRSFCHVDDLIVGLKKLMQSDSNILYPVNLGNPGEFTLLELIKEIENVANKSLKLKFFPLPMDDPKMRKPDIQIARTQLNWEPSIKLKDGLVSTYQYFSQQLND